MTTSNYSAVITLKPVFTAMLAAVALLALPAADSAARTVTIDIKAHPSKFRAGKQVELPVYLVENRAPDDEPKSWFSEYPLGVRWVGFNYTSKQSKFVSFTPVKKLDYRGKYYGNRTLAADDRGTSYVWTSLYSTTGLPGTPDNSGITGRTEIKLGTLRVQVGRAIKKGGRKIVFDAKLQGDPSASDGNVHLWTRPGKTGDITGGGQLSLNGIEPKGVRVYSDDTSSAGLAPGDGVKSAPKKAKPGKKIKIKLTCKTGCQLVPTLKIGKKTVKGLKPFVVKAGAKSVNFSLPSKVNSQISKAVKRGTKVVLTLTPQSRDGWGRALKITIK